MIAVHFTKIWSVYEKVGYSVTVTSSDNFEYHIFLSNVNVNRTINWD